MSPDQTTKTMNQIARISPAEVPWRDARSTRFPFPRVVLCLPPRDGSGPWTPGASVRTSTWGYVTGVLQGRWKGRCSRTPVSVFWGSPRRCAQTTLLFAERALTGREWRVWRGGGTLLRRAVVADLLVLI